MIALTLSVAASVMALFILKDFCFIFSIKLTTNIPLLTTIPSDIMSPIKAETSKDVFNWHDNNQIKLSDSKSIHLQSPIL